MRKTTLYLSVAAIHFVLFLLMFAHAAYRQTADGPIQQEKRELVRTLRLTDLCLFTEANYTRHPSQADWHTPFQDSPMSLEHFPSGALIPPPSLLRKKNGPMD